jgi:hypothetical protein
MIDDLVGDGDKERTLPESETARLAAASSAEAEAVLGVLGFTVRVVSFF